MRWCKILVVAVLAAPSGATAQAHDGPEHVIEALTTEIAASGPSAELHYRRACEYLALRNYAAAASDLEAALRLDADFTAARFDLSRLLMRNAEWAKAEKLLAPLTESVDDSLRAAALALRGEQRAAQGDDARAVADFTAALAVSSDVGWYLRRAQLQQRLGDARDAAAGLRTGYAATASPVLRLALCDALIDAGAAAPAEFALQAALAEASSIVADELASGRFHSRWLVRRARIAKLRGNETAATNDLLAAIGELTNRLDTPRPDPSLLDERAEAYRLQGDELRAKADAAAAAEVRRRLASTATAASRFARSAPTRVEP